MTAFIASMLSWATWALAIYVGYQFGIATGVAFFAVKFIGGTVLSLLVPPGLTFEVIAHIVSLPATPYLVLVVLRSIGLL